MSVATIAMIWNAYCLITKLQGGGAGRIYDKERYSWTHKAAVGQIIFGLFLTAFLAAVYVVTLV
jgi:hypothetical protein